MGKKAFAEAKIYGEAVELASSADKTFSYIPDCSDLDIPEDLDYVYICENNTIYGTKYKTLPNTKGHILVSDVSSCFLSEPMDVTKYGVVYGGVQKNIGPAGVVIAIIREDLKQMTFFQELLQCLSGRHRRMQILFIIHHHATISISVARCSSGLRRWVDFQQ